MCVCVYIYKSGRAGGKRNNARPLDTFLGLSGSFADAGTRFGLVQHLLLDVSLGAADILFPSTGSPALGASTRHLSLSFKHSLLTRREKRPLGRRMLPELAPLRQSVAQVDAGNLAGGMRAPSRAHMRDGSS